MADHKGLVPPGSTQYFYFDTFDGGTGASITMTGLAVTDIEIYKDGGMTQRASTTGYTLIDTDGIDIDTVTGHHGFSIDLSSDATADFFTAGSHYTVHVASVTVDGQTVNFTAGSFTIGLPGAVLNTGITSITDQDTFVIDSGPAEDDALNGSVVYIHDKASAVQGGYAVVTDYTGSTKTVQLLAGPSFTITAGDNIMFFPPANATHIAGASQTAGDVAALVTTVDTVVDGIQTDLSNGTDGLGAIKTDTAAILVDTGTTIPATITTIDNELATVDTVVDGIQTDLDNATDGLGALKTLIDTVDTVVDGIKTVTDSLTDIDTVADAVWDEVLTGATHNVANSAGRRLRQIDAAFEVHSGTAQAGAAGTITLDTGASATNDIYNGDRIIITEGTGAQEHGIVIDYDGGTKVATMAENWVVTPDATSVFEVVPADVDIESVNHATQTAGDLAALITTLDTVADAVKAVTDALPDAGALTTLQADTDDIQTRLPAALVSGKMDSDMTAISGDTTAADRLEALMDGVLIGQVNAGTPTTTTMATDGYPVGVDDTYKGRLLTVLTGTYAGEQTDITAYDATGNAGGEQFLTFTALTNALANDVFFVIH
jgi:hypothetical protein